MSKKEVDVIQKKNHGSIEISMHSYLKTGKYFVNLRAI